MDVDNSGCLSREELLQGLTKIMNNDAEKAKKELEIILASTVDKNDEIDLDGMVFLKFKSFY